MVMFWPIQQELDCINRSGNILGKIKYEGKYDGYVFHPAGENVKLSNTEQSKIDEKLSQLQSGAYAIPMQDED